MKFQVLELEEHLLRHPVYDHVSKTGRDWVVEKGAKVLFIEVLGIAINLSFHRNTKKALQRMLEEARDYSVQKTIETYVAARLRDCLVRWCYTDKFWDLFVSAASLPSEEGSQRLLKIIVEETLRKLHQETQ